MTGENTYIKEMEQQVNLIRAKVNHARIKASESKVSHKLEEVNQLLGQLYEQELDDFQVRKATFEKAFNELNKMIVDNSELGQITEKTKKTKTKVLTKSKELNPTYLKEKMLERAAIEAPHPDEIPIDKTANT